MVDAVLIDTARINYYDKINRDTLWKMLMKTKWFD